MHVAIIMDGNGRWAKERGLPVTAGHKEGIETAKRIILASRNLGVDIITLWAFGTENWKRQKKELDGLFNLFREFMHTGVDEILNNETCLKVIGDIDRFPLDLRQVIKQRLANQPETSKYTVVAALNYGGRMEILRAAKLWARNCIEGNQNVDKLDEAAFNKYLYTSGLPDPDILIRPGKEKRISNFLLWELAYAEFFFLDKYWPDFQARDLEEILLQFNKRERRFGGR